MTASPPGRALRLVQPEPAADAAGKVADPLAPVARAALSGERAAVRTFLVTVGPHLLRVVRRVLGSQHPDLDDVVQESAFALMDALPRHRGECTILHFACRVAVLTAMNTRRRDAARKRLSQQDHFTELDTLAHHAPGPDAALSRRASAQIVRELLDTLLLEQAEALALHCVLGYTVPEIAATTGTPLETIRSRLRLAKHALRERVLGDPRLASLIEEYS
jgi:RNA polymerase sigma factor (sigma-70 family)